ncbi:membrane protein [Gallibacterium genomosp. 3]|uniref:Membrane protein n=1 Tax=Gallibacterium genomosp. 3 TaxID=505345 RepID=A0A1A7PP89_9PAST|nr:porin [Gallibacterium genomosp. 3]OBX02975.1 membrane protein [Gallibacterium genomosp. 3]
MKKTLVAVAVAALAATSANAAVVYNQDGTKVEVGGQLRLLLAKDKHERADLKYGSSRIVAKATHDLGDGFSALANIEVRFDDVANEKQKDGNAYVKRIYAGFAKDGVGQITFGRQLTNLDDVGVSDYTYDLGNVNGLLTTEVNKDIRFRSADFAGFQFGLDYFFGNPYNGDEATQNRYNDKSGFGVSAFYTTELAADTKLNLEAGYSQVKHGNTSTTAPEGPYKEKAYLVGVELASGPFALGVDYSEQKIVDEKEKRLGVGVKYQYLDNAKVYAQYRFAKELSEGETVSKANRFVLGTDYKLTKNVITYVEGSTENTKYASGTTERDNKFRVGLRVLF